MTSGERETGTEIGEAFKQYAWFSVQVDQYYAAVRIYARNHDALCEVFARLPGHKDWPSNLRTATISDTAKQFFITAASALNSMGTTGIFSKAPHDELRDLSVDMINFGFYTCFCFQWTLFESFVKESVLGLARDGLLSAGVAREIRRRERSTASFLTYLDDGRVFGRSPFNSSLARVSWESQIETITLADLNSIREQRNAFIHGVQDRDILPASEVEKERLYERSMWVMRKFAENVMFETQALRARGDSGTDNGNGPADAQPTP